MTALSPLVSPRRRVRATRPAPAASPAPCVRTRAPLRFITFLAPNLLGFYQFLAGHLARRLGCPAELTVGASYDELADADVAFVCGLPYVELAERGAAPVEPIAAPVLKGKRYAGRPVYFSDVIVRRASPVRSFANLRGRSWAYNEPHSQSGYGITRYFLTCQGQTRGFFSKVIEAGWHERAVRLVSAGAVDASAIDSHVLSVMLRDDPALARRLRVIQSLGPSTIQPIVVSRRLAPRLKAKLRRTLLTLSDDPAARGPLAHALIERFTAVSDSSYDDIRTMLRTAAAADFLTLR
jgi:phosphonate transport system substrate-binding protein